MSNFENLALHAAEARKALSATAIPTPDNDNALYYPLLFLTETAEAVLRHALRQSFDAVAEENKAAAAFLAAASRPTNTRTEGAKDHD